MPELPEVESIRLQLARFLIGHKIKSVQINYGKKFEGDAKQILNSRVLETRRFGKVISIDLDNGYSILAHVKMTGQFIYRGPNLTHPKDLSKKVTGGIPGKHTHIIFKLDNNGVLYFNDVRKFGWIRIIKSEEIKSEKFVGKLGPEPPVVNNVSSKVLTLELFKHILSESSRPIKIVIMDQEKISGIGNIYANDALWLAKINPKTPAKKLPLESVSLLYNAVTSVLKEGVKRGGASELSFVTPDGSEGNYQNFTLAYGKEKQLCPNCKKGVFEKFFLGGRGTYICPVCQT